MILSQCILSSTEVVAQTIAQGSNAIVFDVQTQFPEQRLWVEQYLDDCAGVLISLFNNSEVTPPALIKVYIYKDPTMQGISGSASSDKLTFYGNLWPKDKYRLWILAHELVNLLSAHYGCGCYPSDWWSNGRSPFPEYVSCLVMELLGYTEESHWRRSVHAGEPDHELFWSLHDKYGFGIFERFFKLIKADKIDLCSIGNPWPSPDPTRSLYTAAYLSIAASENITSLLTQHNVGKRPVDWNDRHPNIEFIEYSIDSQEVERIMMTRGLVGWWKLDETSGIIAADSSGNANNGTLHGGPVWQPTIGKIGGALQFDGTNDYIDCGNAAALTIQDQITMTCWVKLSALNRMWATILAKGDNSYGLTLAGMNIVLMNLTGTSAGYFYGTKVVTDNDWHNITGVFDGLQATIYIDGVLDAAIPATGQINASSYNLFIGENSQMRGRYLNGLVDDVRIYKRALSSAEVAKLAGTDASDPNLIGWWKLDEGSGTTAYDSSGYNNDGTIHNSNNGLGFAGSVWFNDSERGMVLGFNGNGTNGAYVSAGTIQAMNLVNDFTWAFWAKQDGNGTGSWKVIVGNRTGGIQMPLQFIKFTPRMFEYYNGDGSMSIEYDDIPSGVWLHHSVVKDGTTLTYYRNGVRAGNSTITKTMGANPFYIGGDPGGQSWGGERWRGWISDVRIYNRALSFIELAQLAAALSN